MSTIPSVMSFNELVTVVQSMWNQMQSAGFFFHPCSSSFSAQASGLSELIGPPPLAYKKWRFDGQKHITDIASCGEVLLCMQLVFKLSIIQPTKCKFA